MGAMRRRRAHVCFGELLSPLLLGVRVVLAAVLAPVQLVHLVRAEQGDRLHARPPPGRDRVLATCAAGVALREGTAELRQALGVRRHSHHAVRVGGRAVFDGGA